MRVYRGDAGAEEEEEEGHGRCAGSVRCVLLLERSAVRPRAWVRVGAGAGAGRGGREGGGCHSAGEGRAQVVVRKRGGLRAPERTGGLGERASHRREGCDVVPRGRRCAGEGAWRKFGGSLGGATVG
eukprot:COSAG02_NODE_10035_length_2041_cov_46.642122_1_plen_127_part_00